VGARLCSRGARRVSGGARSRSCHRRNRLSSVPFRTSKHPDYVEARRIDERDAKREAIELDGRARINDDLDERRERWRRRCGLSSVIIMRHTLQLVRRSRFAVPASLEHCEKLVDVLLARKQLSLPPRTRADIHRLLHLTYPVTLPAAGLRSDALACLLWETSWRGMSTVKQTSIPALHVQTLTVKWWASMPEWLRFGSAAHLLRVRSCCVDNLFRFWQCVVERMKDHRIYSGKAYPSRLDLPVVKRNA
jgi:hypothetical protein